MLQEYKEKFRNSAILASKDFRKKIQATLDEFGETGHICSPFVCRLYTQVYHHQVFDCLLCVGCILSVYPIICPLIISTSSPLFLFFIFGCCLPLSFTHSLASPLCHHCVMKVIIMDSPSVSTTTDLLCFTATIKIILGSKKRCQLVTQNSSLCPCVCLCLFSMFIF